MTSFIFQCGAEFLYLLVVLVSLYGGKLRMCVSVLCHVRFFAALWTVTRQALLTMKFSRHEYWSGLPFPSPVDLPNPGIELSSPELQVDSLPAEPQGKPGVGFHSLLQGYS